MVPWERRCFPTTLPKVLPLLLAIVLFLVTLTYFSTRTYSSRDAFNFDLNFITNVSYWYDERMTETEDFPLYFYVNTTKKILISTEVYTLRGRPTKPWYGIDGLGSEPFVRAGCPVWQCELHDAYRNDGKLKAIPVEDYDALIFHDPTWMANERNGLKRRRPEQRYIFWTVESPGLFSEIEKWDELAGFFNWTMTYRWDSDIVHPYGWISPITSISNQQKTKRVNYSKGKTKMAAWFVSNCHAHNGRNEYVKKLQDFIQVDVYGECGTFNCTRTDDDSCRRMVERDYKFYISFENSLCLDYVTEKFYQQMSYNILPIVLDLHGNYARFAPAKSYINALDFPTVRDLADYLKLLDKNDEMYNEYFWWKERYVIHQDIEDGPAIQRGLCRLCSLLHGPLQPRTVYTNLTNWWHTEAQCKSLEFPHDPTGAHRWTAKKFDPDLYRF